MTKLEWATRGFLRGTLIASFAAVFLAACDDGAEREASYIKRGIAFFESGSLAKARTEFLNAAQINPDGAETSFYLALIDEAGGKFADAHSRYRELVEDNPNHLGGLVKLGQYALLANDLETADDLYRRAQAIDARDAETMTLGAALQMHGGFLDEALRMSYDVLAIVPDHPAASTIIAQVLGAQGDAAEAVRVLQSAASRHPENESLRRLLVDLRMRLDDVAAVEAEHRALLAIAPENLSYRTDFVWFLIRENRVDEAERVLAESLSLPSRDARADELYLDFLVNRLDPETAVQRLSERVKREPERHIFRIGLAAIKLGLDRRKEAKTLLKRVVEEDGTGPYGLEAQVLLAEAALAKDKTAKAMRHLESVLAENATHRDALALRAKILLEAEEFGPAIEDLESLRTIAPRSKETLALLSRAYLSTGKVESAIKSLEDLYLLDPANTAVAIELSDLLERAGQLPLVPETLHDGFPINLKNAAVITARTERHIGHANWREALHYSERLTEFGPTSFTGHLLIGRIHEGMENVQAAQQAFETAVTLRPDSASAPQRFGPCACCQWRAGRGQIGLGKANSQRSL